MRKKAHTKRIIIPLALIVVGILIILGVSFFVYTSGLGAPTAPPTSTTTTQSNQCVSSSQCPSGDYCTGYGICVTDFCGDGVCTAQKLQSGSCPIDCGCPSGEVLNRYTNSCQSAVNVSDVIVANVVNTYLERYNITGTITSINNTYYGNQTVKIAYVNCKSAGSTYPCQIVFYVNNTDQIVKVLQSG